jgi:hypothetical protein
VQSSPRERKGSGGVRKAKKATDRQGPPEPPSSPPLSRPDLVVALSLALGSLTLFLLTLAPTVYAKDSAELSTAAAVFGVPHPPGYPLYTLLSGLFVRLVPLGDVAFRSNLFSAVAGALAVSALWLFLRRLGAQRLSALAGTLCFSLGATFWSQCLVAEVHALNCLLLVLTLWAWTEAARAPSPRSFVAFGLAFGFLAGHRNLNLVLLPGLAVVLESGRRRSGASARLHLFALGAALATLLIFAYLPLAARRAPPLNLGAPTTVERFLSMVFAQSYHRHLASGGAQAAIGRLLAFLRALPSEIGVAALAAPLGGYLWARRQPLQAAVFGYFALAFVVFCMSYNVPDIEPYFLPIHLVLSIAAVFAFERLRPVLRPGLVALALVGLPLSYGSVNLRGVTLADDYGRDLLRSAPERALVVTFGDTATHVAWYRQMVKRDRPDVAVVSSGHIEGWYADQLRRAHPDAYWPSSSPETNPGWLVEMVRGNLAARPLCFTHPMPLRLPGWRLQPQGLLHCLGRQDGAPVDVARLERFWHDAGKLERVSADSANVHLQMIAFSYALSRFMFAHLLAEEAATEGALDAARAHLGAVIAARPDEREARIASYFEAVGRRRQGSLFSLAARAKDALQLGPTGDRSAMTRALRLEAAAP